MACVRKKGCQRYEYMDGELIYLLAERMNFTPIYIQDGDGVTYGKEEADGHFSGSLGAIENHKVDIAGNVRVITNLYRTRNLLFLRPIGSMKLVYIVPKNYLKSDFVIFPLSFYTVEVICLYLVTFFSLSLVFYCIKYCSAMQKKKNNMMKKGWKIEDVDLFKIILTMIGIHHSISVKTDFTSTKKRIILGTAFIYSVILSSIYQGSVVRQVNTKHETTDIKTLEELIQTPLQLLIHADLAVHIEYFKEFPKKSTFNHIYKRNVIISNQILTPGDYVAYNRTAALLTLDLYTSMNKITYFDKTSGEERVTDIPVSVKEFFTSITVPKTSPFIHEINYWLSRIDQAGLMLHQYAIAENDLEMEYIKFVKFGFHPNVKLRVLTMRKLNLVFIFLFGMHLVAFAILLCEILWSKRHALCQILISR